MEKVLEIFRKTNALLSGHFKLSSGLHSREYLQCALVLQHPEHARSLGQALAERFKDDGITLVIGPAVGGIIIAHEVAQALGVRCVFTERVDGKMVLRRGFSIDPDEKVIVVEDVITTGGSTKEVIDVARVLGGEIVGVGAIIDRSSGEAEFDCKFESLEKITVRVFTQEDCPLCKKGVPVVKPGSRK